MINKISQKALGFWYRSKWINKIRRFVHYYFLKSTQICCFKKNKKLKLNLGCGDVKLDGFVNIDHRKTNATNFVLDIKRLPYYDNTVDTIETYHVIEHLSRHEFPKALQEWERILIGGGQLIIECPDFDGAVNEYLKGNESRIDNIFGLQRFEGDTHRFGYNEKRLTELLIKCGFAEIKFAEPRDYHKNLEPCLRVECTKNN